jgi:phosphoglycerate dehydrogenase-like enzyme
VDQPALVEALEAGRIAGVFLDVTDPEPLPPDHALWSLPRAFVSPHAAGGRREEHAALVERFLEQLDRVLRGEPLLDRVV